MPDLPHNSLPPDRISTGKAANILRCCPATVVRWCLKGRLRYWRVGSRIQVSEADVRALIVEGKSKRPAPESVFNQRAREKWVQGRARHHKLIF